MKNSYGVPLVRVASDEESSWAGSSVADEIIEGLTEFLGALLHVKALRLAAQLSDDDLPEPGGIEPDRPATIRIRPGEMIGRPWWEEVG